MSLLRNTFSWFRGFKRGGKKAPTGRLQYRATVRQAEATGDTAFLDAEIAKHQPTEDDLKRFREQATPLESWPEPDPELFLPEDVRAGCERCPTDAG
jgi:hypothetical protein